MSNLNKHANYLYSTALLLLTFSWSTAHAQVQMYEEVQPPALTNEQQYQESLKEQGHGYPFEKEENIDSFYQKEEKVKSLQDDMLQDDE